VFDVGCGSLPVYGNYVGNSKIEYYPFDALAYEYERLYQKYGIQPNVAPRFAVMERLSYDIGVIRKKRFA
jgi:hypothetical protein